MATSSFFFSFNFYTVLNHTSSVESLDMKLALFKKVRAFFFFESVIQYWTMEFEKKKDSDFASSYFNCMYVNIVQVVNKTKIRSVEILKRNMKNVRT